MPNANSPLDGRLFLKDIDPLTSFGPCPLCEALFTEPVSVGSGNKLSGRVKYC